MQKEIRESNIGFRRIDKGSRSLKGVTVLSESTNNKYIGGTIGTKFSQNAMKDLATLAEGGKVYIDHEAESLARDRRNVRSIKDLVGYLEGVHVSGGQVKADLRYLKTHSELVEDLAENMPSMIGLSIHAFGPVSKIGQYGIVENFTKVASADLVTDAASNQGGLFESRQQHEKTEELKEGLSDYDRALISGGDLQGSDYDEMVEKLKTGNITKIADEMGRTSEDEYEDILNAPDDDHF